MASMDLIKGILIGLFLIVVGAVMRDSISSDEVVMNVGSIFIVGGVAVIILTIISHKR